MKLCRYDDDRLGVVRGDMVHDVTEAQAQIRAAAPYAMKGDAVTAALPAWRLRLEEMAAKAPGKPLSQVKLLSPVARPSKLVAAPTNYKAHIEEMAARAATQNIMKSPAIGTAGLFLKANSSLVGPSEGVAIRFPERRNEHEVELAIIFGKQGSDISREKALDYVAGYCIGLDMTARGSIRSATWTCRCGPTRPAADAADLQCCRSKRFRQGRGRYGHSATKWPTAAGFRWCDQSRIFYDKIVLHPSRHPDCSLLRPA